MIDDLRAALSLDKGEWLGYIKKGSSSLVLFLACVEKCIKERGDTEFEQGLDSKVKFVI